MSPLHASRALLAGLLGYAGCVLPGFEADDGQQDGGRADACGPSGQLPKDCDRCIRNRCCDLAKVCAQDAHCRADMLERIHPLQRFDPTFEPLLTCMQAHCDAPCNVTWGCLDEYRFPEPAEASFDIRLRDFANISQTVDEVTAAACQGVDVTCVNGRLDSGQSSDGRVTLRVPANFDGFFSFAGGASPTGPYVDATVRWSEPVYRVVDTWDHFMLTSASLRGLAARTQYHASEDEPFPEGTAHLIVRVQGCLPIVYLNRRTSPHAEAPGVTIEASPGQGASRFFYTDDSGTVASALNATSIDGVAGAFDLPAASILVTARNRDGVEVASAAIPLWPGQLGYAYLLPRAQH